nr:MAG TPA: hypothetical protein [Caudoviricetes sp.]
MYTPVITSQSTIDEVAAYFPATLTESDRGRLVTAPDGIPVSILGADRDECGDLIGTTLRVETGTRDDWVDTSVDLSEYASMDPDAQLCDALCMHDRVAAEALTDEADELLRAMAGDWVHDVSVTVRAAQDFECSVDFEGGRGFEVVAHLSGSDLGPDRWPLPYGDTSTGQPLTVERVCEIAAQALDLEARIQDAWVDQACAADGEVESDLSVWRDSTWDGRPITWVTAVADDADDSWPSVGVTTDLAVDGCDLTACIWDGLRPDGRFSVTAMTPRQALHEALERLMDQDLPDTRPGDGRLARWSRIRAAHDE